MGSFGAFKHLLHAEIHVGLFGDIGKKRTIEVQQASLTLRLGKLIPSLNDAPRLKAVDLFLRADTSAYLATNTASMAALRRLRHGFEVRAAIVALDDFTERWTPKYQVVMQDHHTMLEDVGIKLSESEKAACKFRTDNRIYA